MAVVDLIKRLLLTSLRRHQSFTSQSNPNEYNPPPEAVTLEFGLPVADDMATFHSQSGLSAVGHQGSLVEWGFPNSSAQCVLLVSANGVVQAQS